uniref:Putative secreted protein n=1 Tax=Ixodes scapularis TaxID=6945 RepID=A0A4D5RX06_IXOSC
MKLEKSLFFVAVSLFRCLHDFCTCFMIGPLPLPLLSHCPTYTYIYKYIYISAADVFVTFSRYERLYIGVNIFPRLEECAEMSYCLCMSHEPWSHGFLERERKIADVFAFLQKL